MLIEVSGVRHTRHARIIEAQIKSLKGIINVSVSGTGFIQLEYNKENTSEEEVVEQIKKSGLKVKRIEDFHTHEAQIQKDTKKPSEQEHKHDDHEKHDHAEGDHEHAHGGIFGERTELIFAIICGALLGIGFGLSVVKNISFFIPSGFYIGAYFFGGFYTTKEAIEGISKGDFEIDFLMLVAAIGAAILGQWGEGGLLLFLFSLGHSLEHYAMEKAKRSIAALTELAPKTALLKNGEDIKEVKIEELKAGDVIVVKLNSTISADGIVVNGNSSVNQAPITGESIPVDKIPVEDVNMDIANADKLDAKYSVFAGSINGGQALEIKVSKVAANSTIARLVKLVNEAQTQKSPTQNFTDKLEKYYVPSVLILVGLLLFAFLF